MSSRRGERDFHAIYDDKIFENMKRYYGIDTNYELIEFIKRNHLLEPDEGDIMRDSKY